MSDVPYDPHRHPLDAELDLTNPYRSLAEADETPLDPKRSTSGLATVCIIAAVLGGVGLMSAVNGIAGLAMSSTVQANLQSQLAEGTGDPVADSALQMQLDVQKMTADYLWFHVLTIVLLLIICPALLTGAIMAFQRKAVGRKLLIAAMLAAILFEVGRAVPTTRMQLKMGDAMRGMMQEMGAQAAPQAGEDGPDMERFTGAMGAGIAILLLVFSLGWTAIKLVFYLLGWRYLRKPEVAALFVS